MKLKSLEAVLTALGKKNIRYLVAGGLAVVAHGYLRFTADIDLIIDMEEKNLQKAMEVFKSLGYRPRAPVALEEFIDPEKRRIWINDKGLTVFSLWNSIYPATEIDLFVESPIDFEEAYSKRVGFKLAEGLEVTVIGIDDLIFLKRLAGRDKDIDDIEKLSAIKEDGEP